MKKFKFIFNGQFTGQVENIVTTSDNITNEKLAQLFEEVMGLPIDDNCYIVEVDNEKYNSN